MDAGELSGSGCCAETTIEPEMTSKVSFWVQEFGTGNVDNTLHVDELIAGIAEVESTLVGAGLLEAGLEEQT